MSDADELLKYKKLLDDGIITQAEFDIKKDELTGGDGKQLTQNPRSQGLNGGSTFLIGLCVLVISMMIFPLMGWNLFGSNQTSSSTKSSRQPSEKDLAEYYAKEEIKKELKAPSTANILTPIVIELSPHTYSVTGELDAENDFGAKLRKKWTCKINFPQPDRYKSDCAVVN